MPQKRIRASFMRGGTSKALMFRREDLPADRAEWADIFLPAMGSPDPNGRQLDGMGGGVSSVSKVCVVGPSTHPEADVDYTFFQLMPKADSVDCSGSCGNMSSAIGPFAVEEGLAAAPRDGEAMVRIHDTNTGKIIISRFTMADGLAEVDGDLALDGVAGTGAPIRIEFTRPDGSRTGKLLPTGRPRDRLDVPGLGAIEVSMVDAVNPCVFVHAADLGKTGAELPDALDADPAFLERMNAVRCAASVAMGLAPDVKTAATIASVPKVAMLCAPAAMTTISGRALKANDMSLAIRMLSMGQPHRAVPITGATCLAIASRIEGTIAHELSSAGSGPISIAHPSGVTVVDAKVEHAGDPARASAVHGAVYRTMRRLFDGYVYYRPRKEARPALKSAAE